MPTPLPEPQVDRTVLKVTSLNENDEDSYWWSRTPLERLEAIETNRRIVYGYNSTPPKFKRVLEVVSKVS